MDPDRGKAPLFFFFLSIVLFIILVGLFTPLNGWIRFRLENIKSEWYLRQHPPEEAIFRPQEAGLTTTATVPIELSATSAPSYTPTASEADSIILPTHTMEPTPTPTNVPTPTAIPLPEQFALKNVSYEDQHGIWNYCAPTNLSIVMNYWGWDGDRLDIGQVVKPFDKDKNVMYYELQNFVSEHSDLRSIVRVGGTADLLKRLIVNGFPVLIEKGAFMQEVNGKYSWMGHYNVIIGYDDAASEWIVQDTYYTPNYHVAYDLLSEQWRGFNNAFMIVYPGNLEADLYNILQSYTNEEWATKYALAEAEAAIDPAADAETLFYAYFNRGAAMVDLQDYYGGAQSFDMAFTYYEDIENDRRPYRMVWYRTEPYPAYYYSGRYYDLISLVETTLASTHEPYLEESYYWRAMAYNALGETGNAETDLQECLTLHENFEPCVSLLNNLGNVE